MSHPPAPNQTTIDYLRLLLARAERGELLFLVASAGVADIRDNKVQQFDVVLSAAIDPKVLDFDAASIRNGLQATLTGASHAVHTLHTHGVSKAEEAEARDRPRILQ